MLGHGSGMPFAATRGKGFWRGGINLFFSQASYDAYIYGPKTLVSTAVLTALGITNSVATTNPPGTVTGRDGTVGYGAHNLLVYSQTLTNGAWGYSDGTGVAVDAQTISLPSSASYFGQSIQGWLNGVQQTWSCEIKAGTKSGTVVLRDANGAGSVVITLTSAWQAVSFTGTPSAQPYFLFDNRVAQGGDGVAGTILVRYCQLQRGTKTLDYVPTTTAAVYAPRITFDRGAGSNIAIQSETLGTSWTLIGSASRPQSGTHPLSATPYRINESTTANDNHGLSLSGASIPTVNGACVFAFDFAPGERTRVLLRENTSIGFAAAFDLSAGVVLGTENGAVAWMKPIGAGWYRCFLSCPTLTAGARAFALYLLNASGTAYANTTYVGTAGYGVWASRAQLVNGSVEQAYLRTFATAPLTTAGTPRSQNLFTYSSDISNATWNKTAYGNVNAATRAASGLVTAAGSGYACYQRVTVTAGTVYTLAVTGKDNTGAGAAWAITGNYSTDGTTYGGNLSFAGGAQFLGSTTATYYKTFVVPAGTVNIEIGISSQIAGTNTAQIDAIWLYEGSAQLASVATTDTAYSEYPQLGLVREESRTNIFLNNTNSTAGLTLFGTTNPGTNVPFLTSSNDGILFQEDTSTGQHGGQQTGIACTTSQASTFSFYFRAGNNRRYAGLFFSSGFAGTEKTAVFDLQTGAVVSVDAGVTAGIIPWNGGYRCWMSAVATATTTCNMGFRMMSDATTISYIGVATNQMYCAGGQVEQNATFPTSLINTTASVTRSVDLIRPPTSYINAAGPQSLMMEIVPAKVATGASQHLMAAGGSGVASYIHASGFAALFDGTNAALSAATMVDNVLARTATRWSSGGIGVSLNGGAVATSSFDGGMGSGGTVGIGDDGAGGSGYTGLITRIAIKSSAANDADLQAASAGTK